MSTGIGVGISSVFTSRPAGGPSVVLEYSTSDYCETQTPSVITPTVIQPAPPAGVFTSSGSGLVVNPNSGVFNIGISNIGNYIITYTVAGVGSANFPVNISALDDSSFSYSASSFRQNASNPAPTITGLVGGVFSGPTGIIFADSGTNTNSSSGIINLAASTVGGPYTITYTTTGNCPSSSTFNVTVQVALSITYSAASFCEDGGNTAAPTVVGDPGSGTFASTTGLTINSTTGVINTDTSTPDDNTPYTVTYTASTGETATTQVTIKNLDNATFSYSASAFCADASNQTPSITTPGGTFSAAPLFTGLLDTYTGSEAAYSLRRLSSSYTGNLIRVTKKVSNVISTTDIGYNSSNELDTTALATFASGADNGEVRVDIWYDQSGNGNNVTQSTFTSCPFIYQSGSLLTSNGKPWIVTSTQTLQTNNQPLSSLQQSGFFVGEPLGLGNYKTIFTHGDYYVFHLSTTTQVAVRKVSIAKDTNAGGDFGVGTQSLLSYYNDSTDIYMRQDGSTIGTKAATPVSYTAKDINFGNFNNVNRAFYGYNQEHIIFPSEQSSNMSGIETNINNYYTIY